MPFLKKLFAGIKKMFIGLRLKSKVWVHIAVIAVQEIKKVMDSPVPDVLTSMIKGEWDDRTKNVIREWVPKVLIQLKMIEAVTDITDVNEQLNAILAKLKLADKETRNIVWHGLGSLIIEKLSDGKFSWADSVAVSQYYYDHILDTDQAVTPQQITEGLAESD